MIYDGHAYCFPNLNGLGGFNDFKTFNKHQQIAISQHFQPVWSDIDRKIIKDVSKIKPADKWYIKSAKDIDFNPAHRGRYEWTDKGVKYVKQYMPPSVANMEYMPEDLIAEMDYAGVDMALLHRTPYLGIGNKYIYDCVQHFPDRLQGLAHVPEWEIFEKLDQSIDNLVYAITKLNMKGLQFLPDHMTLYGKEENWDSPVFKPFWDVFADLNVPLFITPGYNSLQGTSDLIENFFIRLFRGSGLKGLSSMSESAIYNSNLKIIRPFLNFKKDELKYVTLSFFKTYIQDPSNRNEKFLRVRIRKYRKNMEKEGLGTSKIIKTVNNLLLANKALNFYKNKALNKYAIFPSKNICLINKKIFLEEAEEIIFKSFSDILCLISEKYYPPRSAKINSLISRAKKSKFNKCTLGGCVIEKKDSFFRITKNKIREDCCLITKIKLI